jgi:hypothetical protein
MLKLNGVKRILASSPLTQRDNHQELHLSLGMIIMSILRKNAWLFQAVQQGSVYFVMEISSLEMRSFAPGDPRRIECINTKEELWKSTKEHKSHF